MVILLPVFAWGEEKIVEEIVAVVNNQAITKSDFLETKNTIYRALATRYSGEELQKKFEEAQSTLLDNMIEDKLLIQEAKLRNFDVESEIDAGLERVKKENNIKTDEALNQALATEGFTPESYRLFARERLIKGRLISQEIEGKIEISEDEVRNYYSSHLQEFEIKPKVRLCEIIFSVEGRTPEEATRLANETLTRVTTGGEDFGTVAGSVSDAPSKSQKGDLGWIEETDLAADLKQTITDLPAGAVAPVMTNDKGSRIIKVEERQAATTAKFDDVKGQIDEKLRNDQRDKDIKVYIDNLKKDSYIYKSGESKK